MQGFAMKLFRIFFVCVLFSKLVQSEPIDPVKAYVSQLKTAHENDKVAIALLATLYQFLPDNTSQAAGLKKKLAQEFERKFHVSINKANENLIHEEQGDTFLADAGIGLAAYADERIVKREAEAIAQISYMLLSYALSKVNFETEYKEKAAEAQKIMHHLATKYPDVKTLSECLKDAKSTDQLIAKIQSLFAQPQIWGCFAGICLTTKGGIVSLLFVFGLPFSQYLFRLWKSANVGIPNRDDDSESIADGGDNDPDDNDNNPPRPGPRDRQDGDGLPLRSRRRQERLRDAHQAADELDQQLAGIEGNGDESSTHSSVRSTPSSPRRRGQGSLPWTPNSGGLRSPFVRGIGSRGTVDPVISPTDPRAVDARSRMLGGPANWSH